MGYRIILDMSRSFKLNRTFEGQEQLDVSLTNEFNSRYFENVQLSISHQ